MLIYLARDDNKDFICIILSYSPSVHFTNQLYP